ncbi:MAG TPA: hypothetical protein VFW29_00015 [Solirubrobacteraceae bacterium]|nr:hypothetical protein [Solirubrobacteraceae bacterium]
MRVRLRAALGVACAASLLLALALAPTASASQIIEFENAAALAANGTVPPVPANPLEEAKEACGSETVTWGSELLTTPPGSIKVNNEWGDIIAGKEMMVSGTVHDLSTPGDADIPVDHPFSADTTFDVQLDEPYWNLARELQAEKAGQPSKHELHMELETGAFPHAFPQKEGPEDGQPWDLLEEEVMKREEKGEPANTLVDDASLGLESGYIPQEGDRVAMRGRWIIDCGHNDFHGELHPISFMAFGHAEGNKTVAHVLANPYRVTQLYGSGGTNELIPSVPRGKPFGPGLEESVSTLVKRSVFTQNPFPLSLKVGLEATSPSTAPFTVCAPEGGSPRGHVAYSLVRRSGVKIKAAIKPGGRCVTLTATIEPERYKVAVPRARTCTMPWPWLDARIAESLELEGLRNNEAERITVNATGGTFTVTYEGETTGPIAYNASPGEVQTAIDSLPAAKASIGVVGAPGTYTLVFGGALAERSINPVTTNRSGLTGGAKLATVVVLRPGGPLDLRRFILSEIEQQQKASLEQAGFFAGIERIERNMALDPRAACLDSPAAPTPNPEKHQTQDNTQPFPYYGEITVEHK